MVNNHGDRCCPLSRVVGPLPNGLNGLYMDDDEGLCPQGGSEAIFYPSLIPLTKTHKKKVGYIIFQLRNHHEGHESESSRLIAK